MARDRQLEAERQKEEERKRAERVAKSHGQVSMGANRGPKKVVTAGVVKKPITKRGGRGF